MKRFRSAVSRPARVRPASGAGARFSGAPSLTTRVGRRTDERWNERRRDERRAISRTVEADFPVLVHPIPRAEDAIVRSVERRRAPLDPRGEERDRALPGVGHPFRRSRSPPRPRWRSPKRPPRRKSRSLPTGGVKSRRRRRSRRRSRNSRFVRRGALRFPHRALPPRRRGPPGRPLRKEGPGPSSGTSARQARAFP
jgi:hypothetical protein